MAKDRYKGIKAKHMDVYGQAGFDIFPNQWQIKVVKPKPKPQFTSIEDRYGYPAMQELTGNSFKLYFYLSGNKNAYEFALSPKAVMRMTGMSKSSYDRAKKELVDKGYLINYHDVYKCEDCPHVKDCKNKKQCDDIYYFTPIPKYQVGDIKEWFKWCYETNEDGYEYDPLEDYFAEFDEDGYLIEDEDDDFYWRSNRFEYYTDK